MKDLIHTFKRDINYNKYFQNENICFLDIETTGFSRKKHIIYLIGIQYYNQVNKEWCLRQLFAENTDEELDILLKFIEIITGFDKIITYNGDTFDIPFINERLKVLNIQYVLEKDKSLDLYKIIKESNTFLGLSSLKLKSIEEYLGLYREDLYNGKDCIGFYFDYIKTFNEESFNKIIQHNYDDLYYMIDILKIFDIINKRRTIDINYNGDTIKIKLKLIEINGEQLIANGILLEPLNKEFIHFDKEFNFSIKKDDGFDFSIDCALGLVSPTNKGNYIDKQNLVLSKDIIDNTKYSLPNNFLLLKVEKNYCIDNIINLIKVLIEDSIQQY